MGKTISKISFKTKNTHSSDLSSQTLPYISRLRTGSFINDLSKHGITLRYILATPRIYQRFFDIAVQQRCEENLLFLFEMNSDIDLIDDLQWNIINKIWVTYIKETSYKQINVASDKYYSLNQAREATNLELCVAILIEIYYQVFADVKRSFLFLNFINNDPEIKNIFCETDRLLLHSYLKIISISDIKICFPKNEPLYKTIDFAIQINDLLQQTNHKLIKSSMYKLAKEFLQTKKEILIPSGYYQLFKHGKIECLNEAYLDTLLALSKEVIFMNHVKLKINEF